MEMILSFLAGLLLAGIGAFFMLRSHKLSAATVLQKALDDAEKQSASKLEAATARLQSDLDNANQKLAQTKADEEEYTQKLLQIKEEAHTSAMAELNKRHKADFEALEQRFKDAMTADKDRLDTAIEALKADVKNKMIGVDVIEKTYFYCKSFKRRLVKISQTRYYRN